jgi:hypothetical protein
MFKYHIFSLLFVRPTHFPLILPCFISSPTRRSTSPVGLFQARRRRRRRPSFPPFPYAARSSGAASTSSLPVHLGHRFDSLHGRFPRSGRAPRDACTNGIKDETVQRDRRRIKMAGVIAIGVWCRTTWLWGWRARQGLASFFLLRLARARHLLDAANEL